MSYRISTREQGRVGAFVAGMLDCHFYDFEALGLERDGELIAGVVYNEFTGPDVQMHVAAIPGRRWLTKEFLWFAFAYPFVQLGCVRVSGRVGSKNKDALRLNYHLGFEYEATLKHAILDEDLILLVMWQEKCRFLNMKGARKWAGKEAEQCQHPISKAA